MSTFRRKTKSKPKTNAEEKRTTKSTTKSKHKQKRNQNKNKKRRATHRNTIATDIITGNVKFINQNQNKSKARAELNAVPRACMSPIKTNLRTARSPPKNAVTHSHTPGVLLFFKIHNARETDIHARMRALWERGHWRSGLTLPCCKKILKDMPDFKMEISELNALWRDRGHGFELGVKCHPEMAGSGIEYCWGKVCDSFVLCLCVLYVCDPPPHTHTHTRQNMNFATSSTRKPPRGRNKFTT